VTRRERDLDDDERKERRFLDALDVGVASGRVAPGVWERVIARARHFAKPR